MPTGNRRVATYLPKQLDERFNAFKTERGINGDSQTLIVILSEFLGVSQQVTHQSSLLTVGLENRLEALEERLTHLKSELLSELKSELLKEFSNSVSQVGGVESELSSELLEDKLTSDQLNLLSEARESESELPNDSVSESLEETELAQRLGCGKSTLRGWKAKGAEFLAEKTKAKSGGVAWAFNEATKRYYSISDAVSSSQINPIAPEGSERSGEG